MCLSPIYLKEKFLDRKNMSDGEYTLIKFLWKKEKDSELIGLPCGRCAECMQQRSIEWTYRLKEELKYHKEFCFVTLTYAESSGELQKRDYQLFLKRLRKHIAPKKIRYFLAGEYGSKGKREHFHIVIFGWMPSDLEYFYEKDGIKYYLSKELFEIWQHGYILVQRVDEKNLKYLTKYLQKLNEVKEKKQQPFVAMSTRPGIGYNSIDCFDLFDDKLYQNGKYIKLPRYWLKVLEKRGFGEEIQDLKQKRILKAKRFERKQKDFIKDDKKNNERLLTKKIK